MTLLWLIPGRDIVADPSLGLLRRIGVAGLVGIGATLATSTARRPCGRKSKVAIFFCWAILNATSGEDLTGGGGRIGPGVDTKRGGLWRPAIGAQAYRQFELYLALLRVFFS
ncbi:hypothetical protein THAOC_06833 [Thalassiosira oceanica]|uniref:Uncharacterized protein n=1 Tax=Thalassiosira oceanica TaxID=159749 RepID=K0TLB7_THAOC|nr:hypothetical protein THAOC_06833 [Thalassiosira oceanica]|eukprot:EJK71702.1 hypothetical protein THAOC_06833 [Thalassiosira oceanica]